MSEHTYIRQTLLDCGKTTLQLKDAEFIIDPKKEVGRGGTCLVYHACKKENPNIFRRVLLKEFYPLTGNCQSWRQADGSLILPENNAEVDFKKIRFDRSRALFIELHNDETLNPNTAETQDYIDANGTVYMVVDYGSGKSLQDYFDEGSHSLFDTFTLLRKLAVVLDRIHAKNYLHMDLKPDNVLCHGDGIRVIDTDSFLELDTLKGGSRVDLSFSQGFAAPEVLTCAEHPDYATGWKLLSQSGLRADVYSFGAIVYQYLFAHAPEPGIQPRRFGPQIMEKLRVKDPDIPIKAVKLIQTLLYKTLARLIDDRYVSMENIISQLDQILDLVRPRKIRILEEFYPNRTPVFGREQLLTDLHAKLTGQNSVSRIVFLCGMGGVGKSTLARLYAETYRSEYDVITEVSASSAAEAVKRITILGWEPDKDLPEPELIRSCKEKLAELNQDLRTLIIVNNYDVSEDPLFSIWEALPCDIILTSRHQWNNRPSVQLSCSCLPPQAAKDIFTHHYLLDASAEEEKAMLLEKIQQEEQDLSTLLARMDFHPLGIRLTARYMAEANLLPSQALQKLTVQGFRPDSVEAIQIDRDGGILEKNAYGHLRSIFHFRQFTPREQSALRYMLLTGPNHGISEGRFSRWTGEEPSLLKTLRKHGWLEYVPGMQDPLDTETHQGIYQLPTILQQVLQQEADLECTCENCGPFLNVAAEADVDNYSSYTQRRSLCDTQERLITLFDQEESELYARLLHTTAANLYKLNPYQSTAYAILYYSQKCVDILFALGLKDHPLIGDCYANMGVIYQQVGQRHHAYHCFRYALDFEKKNNLRSPSNESQLNLNFSALYWEKGDLDTTMFLARKALALVTLENGSYSSDAVNVLYILGFYLQKTGHLEEAKTHLTAAERLYTEHFGGSAGSETTDLFISIQLQLGTLYLELEMPDIASEYLLRALEPAKALYGESNLSVLLEVLLALANACIQMGDKASATIHREAALELLRSNSTKTNWSLAEHYVYSALDFKPMDLARLHRLSGKTDPTTRQWKLAHYMIQLGVDYIHTDPQKPTYYIQSGIAAFNAALGEYLVDWGDEEKLYRLYYRQAYRLFYRNLIPDGFAVLEAWADLCRRLYGNTMETATEYWCLYQIYRYLRFPKKANHYRKLAQSCKEWSLRRMLLQWLHTGYSHRHYNNSNGIYVCQFHDRQHFTQFTQLLHIIRRIRRIPRRIIKINCPRIFRIFFKR